MLRFLSLVKAMISNDNRLFDVKGFKSRGLNRFVAGFLSFLFTAFFVALNLYAYNKLNDPDLHYIALICGLIMCSTVSFSEAIIKSKIILFESKDTQMLMALPLSAGEIMSAYMSKFLVLQILFNLNIYLPTVITYAYFNDPGIFFYAAATLGAILLPVVPTLFGTLIGYGICRISLASKNPKKFETWMTIIICLLVILILDRMDPILSRAISINARGLDGVLEAYLPVYTLVQAITQNNFSYLIVFVSINLLSVIILFWAFAKMYYGMLNRKKAASHKNEQKKKRQFSVRSPLATLVRAEIKRFFDSPLYVITSLCGLALMIVSCAVIALRYSDIMRKMLGANLIMFALIKPYLSFGYLIILMIGVFVTCISASSISLEGKLLEYNRCLPVPPQLFLRSKVYASLLIVYPVVLICDLMFFIRFDLDFLSIVSVLFASVIIPLLNAMYGLTINLLFPNMASNKDSEGIKYGPNTILVSLSGILVCALNCVIVFILKVACKDVIVFGNIVYVILCVILYRILNKWGAKRYRQINENS